MWQIASALTQKLPAEMAHNVAVKALSLGLGPRANLPLMTTHLAGLELGNPLGLAAGFDKNAEAFAGAFGLGFGFVEVGTITPLPQPGNPRPRVFRLPDDEAVINRYGFNGQGMVAAAQRLRARTPQKGQVLGVNIGANKLTQDKPADYYKTAHHLGGLADYVTVNISSPNTPGLRDLQDADGMKATLQATFDGLKSAGVDKPVFVKLAPDLSKQALAHSIEAACHFAIAGFILTNTTISRPDDLSSPHKGEAGGLSGRPVAALSEQSLDDALAILAAHNAQMAVVSVGGIFNAVDVYARLLRGADATQLYSSLSLKGVGLPQQIIADLAQMVAHANQGNFAQAITALRGTAPTMAKARKTAETVARSALGGPNHF